MHKEACERVNGRVSLIIKPLSCLEMLRLIVGCRVPFPCPNYQPCSFIP